MVDCPACSNLRIPPIRFCIPKFRKESTDIYAHEKPMARYCAYCLAKLTPREGEGGYIRDVGEVTPEVAAAYRMGGAAYVLQVVGPTDPRAAGLRALVERDLSRRVG